MPSGKKRMEIADEGDEELLKRLASNPKIQKALKGLLKPLKQKGDTLTIKNGKETN